MALPPLVRQMVDAKLKRYANERVPAHVRDEVRLNHKVRGNYVTLFEERPSIQNPSLWVDMKVAQFRFDPASHTWSLFWCDRNGRWHPYAFIDAPPDDLVGLLQEVDDDPTGIFWG